MKKKLMLVGALVLSLVLISCGKKDSSDTPTSTPTSNTGSQSSQLTVAQYKEEVQKIFGEIEEASLPMSSINMADPTGAMNAAKEVIEKTTPLYERLGSLNAPASLSEAQVKLKDGADASLELIKLSSEMFEFTSNPPSDMSVLTSKMQEIQEKMNELQTKAIGMTEAMSEIMTAE